MGTSFLLIFTFLFFQTGSTSVVTTSSNVTCKEKERQSLLLFKLNLIDEDNLLSTWNGVECCEWRGVGCDTRNGHVVKLDLRSPVSLEADIDKWLAGELSPSLQNLKHLRYLDLSMNGFSGNIPEFLGSFEHLEYLNLSGTSLGGVVTHHLGNLSRLQYLDLKKVFVTNDHGFFSFNGEPILDDLGWLSSLSSLKYLDLSGINIGKHIDWFHSINMLHSLLTLNLLECGINIPSIKFANFTSLNSLDLSNNGINSTFPVWLSNLTGLMHVSFYSNQFHGKIPDFLGTFSTLASIDLSYNDFDAWMPDVLCNLSSLAHLDLSTNKFSGHIPASLGLLLMLEDLNLGYNQFSGNIPMSLWQLSKLKNLDLSYNLLVGVLSENHFTNLKYLNSLTLSSNSLTLNFNSQWIPPFQLRIFTASSCNIGPNFPNWLQTQTSLKKLHLSNSSIRDTMPEWLQNIPSHILELDLSNNQIGGKLPQFNVYSSNEIGDRTLKMNSNKFEGLLTSFPSNVYFLDLSDNLLSGPIPQTDETMNPNLQVVNLSKNRFTGSIPVHLCKLSSIYILDISQNKLSGRIPGCLGNLNSLQAMDLANNTIAGVVPTTLGSLTNLISLHLHNNRFEGDIPLSFQNLTNLVTMDLGNNLFTGTIPFWIGEKLSNLKYLDLHSNQFTCKIPLQLCQLNALQYLNLAHNNIFGMIPRCLGNLSGMNINQDILEITVVFYQENILASLKGIQLEYTKTLWFLTSLDLSSNNITGEIPDALVNLVGLKNLNLSRNQLKGHIPMKIGNLSQIESLDLSMNMLSGRIPQSLTSLNFLSYLNLSFNNLSGAIPIGNQLQTLTDPFIYEGNDGLCGPPISRSCKGNNLSYDHVGEDEGQDDDEALWFYSGMGSGFVTGFTGLVGSLYFMRTWRLSYFKILENVYDWVRVLILLNLARLSRKFF